jgi:hypothetical protein
MDFADGFGLPRRRIGRRRAPLDGFAALLFAAFSFRLLTSAYTGPCIRVRRSSDNALMDIGFSAGWLDVAALLAFVGAGSGYVVTFYDQSGRGRHITQTTAAAQRRIVNAGVLESFGGRPALAGGAGQYYGSAWPALAQPATILATLKLPDYTAGGDQNLIRTNVLATGYNGVPYIRAADGKATLYAGAGLAGATLVDGTAYALAWVMAGAASAIGTNGAYVAGDAGTEAINAAPNVFAGLAGGAPILGQCGDLLLFDAALTPAQITTISRTIGETRGIVIP